MAYSSMWSALARCFCSALVGTGSETIVEQESQQVGASGIDPSICFVKYTGPYNPTFYEEESEFSRRSIDLDGLDGIILSEMLSRVITKDIEFAAVGSDADSNNDSESKLNICDGGCTTTLTSSFENCADCKPRITKIKSAEGGMVLKTWAQQFCQSSGYEKWHRRLGHTSNKDIQDTIKHVIGLEDLLQSTHENMRSVRFD